MHRVGNRGLSLLVILISGLLATSGLALLLSSMNQNRVVVKRLEQINLAQNYAAELLETLVSISGQQLTAHLSAIPDVAGTPAYPLCAHINIMDRAATNDSAVTLLNPDPIATLPAIAGIENRSNNKFNANRFYQVQVVDQATMVPNPGACGRIPAAGGSCGVNGGQYVLCAAERFLVTVGVSFVPNGKDLSNVERVVISSLLARI